MFEIVICDDDDACLEQTCQLVNDWKAAISTPISVKTMESGDKLLEYCAKNSPDVILLDIMMPLLNGMDAARELREHNLISKIIFLTTSPEFAIESYDVDASGYLLKPVDTEEVHNCLDKVRKQVEEKEAALQNHTSMKYQLQETEIIYMEYLMRQFVSDPEFEKKEKIREIFPIEQPGYLFFCNMNIENESKNHSNTLQYKYNLK